MNQNQDEEKEEEKEEEFGDDLQEYLKDMEYLESDFSDLDDLDMEELKDMQEAIAQVREQESITPEKERIEEIPTTDLESIEIETKHSEETEYIEQKEAMITDFSDIEQIDFDELKDMKDAIETVKQEEILTPSDTSDISDKTIKTPGISHELEERIKQELLKKKEKEEKEIITPEKFLEYVKSKRDKIWYHALYYLVFNVEDHIATKALLYDVLKEVTSKSPIDPIPEHQFYFGLGYILRLTLNDKKIIRYMSGGKFKININVETLRELLEQTGEPISTRPIIKEEEKKKMFSDFLKDDFSDI